MIGSATSATNTFHEGMNMDADKSVIKNTQYKYAENVRCITDSEGSSGSLVNSEGAYLIEQQGIPKTEKIIATDTIRDTGVVFTSIVSDTDEIESTTTSTVSKEEITIKVVYDDEYVSDQMGGTTRAMRMVMSSNATREEFPEGLTLHVNLIKDNVIIPFGSKMFSFLMDDSYYAPGTNHDTSDQHNCLNNQHLYMRPDQIDRVEVVGISLPTNQYVKYSSDEYYITFKNYIGDEYSVPIVYPNSIGLDPNLGYDIPADRTYEKETIIYKKENKINIYKLNFQSDKSVSYTRLLKDGGLSVGNLPYPIGIVSRYEDTDNIKVYWTDGVNPIRMINIAKNSYLEINDISYFDIVAPVQLKQPLIEGIGSGRLNSGIIQYAYQVSSIQGSESRLSPASKLISLSSKSSARLSKDILGDGLGDIYGKPTGKSVKLKLDVPITMKPSRLKLISIYYYDYNQSPKISIIKDIKIDKSSTTNGYIHVEDSGAFVVGELSVSEYNAIGGDIPIAATIESKDDMLFAGNIKENIFDVDYDTRAYQFKSNITVIPGYTIPASIAPATSTVTEFNVTRGSEYNDQWTFNLDIPDGIIGNNISLTGWVAVSAYISVAGGSFVWQTLNQSVLTVDRYSNTITIDGGVDLNITVAKLKIQAPLKYTPESIIPPTTSESMLRSSKILDNDGTSFLEVTKNTYGLVPYDHGCVHPEIYTVDSYKDITYRYDSSGNLGGEGPNVSYLFTNSRFIESYSNVLAENSQEGLSYPETETAKLIDRRYPRIGDVKRSITGLDLRNSDGTESIGAQNIESLLNISKHDGPLNYANPLIANAMKSHQRDEIYRFGIRLGDADGRRSDVKWVADIRFPAGYYKDSKWNAAIFQMPEENYPQSTFIDQQELVVNPLGVSFKFKNIPSSVKSIEVVRAKRDLNNKTIYAQGAIQKLGTYTNDLASGDSDNSTNHPQSGILLPHPIVSMAYNYALLGPAVDTKITNVNNYDDPKRFMLGTPNGVTNQTSYKYTFDGEFNYGEEDGDWIKVKADFTKFAYAPYFSNMNNFMFISPEVSYYGDDFASQIELNSGAMKLSMANLIFPVSTRAIKLDNTNYYGKSIEPSLVRTDLSGSYNYPHAMYFGADLNKNNINTNSGGNSYVSTFGLVGVHPGQILDQQSGGVDDWIANDLNQDKFDIYTYTNSTKRILSNNNNVNNTDIGFVRSFIATGGMFSALVGNSEWTGGVAGYLSGANSDPNSFKYVAGYANVEPLSDKAPLLTNQNIETGCIGGTFKYYRSINDRIDSGSPKVHYVIQKGRELYDREILVTDAQYMDSNINMTYEISDIKYSGDIVHGKKINEIDGLYYKNIGGRLFLNWSRALTFGDDIRKGQDGSLKDRDSSIAAMASTKVQGIHGDGLIINMTNENSIPSIGRIEMDRFGYYSGRMIYSSKERTLDQIGAAGLSTYIMNLKSMNSSIYGGNKYFDRQYTEYISTGFVKDISSTSAEITVFGGDTFIGVFDYTVVRATDPFVGVLGHEHNTNQLDVSEVLAAQTKHVGALIPLESSINMHLVSSKSYVNQECAVGVIKDAGSNLILGNSDGTYTHSQSVPQYEYNPAYSSDQIAAGFLSRLEIDETNKRFDCRVINSQKKTNDELYDSWAVFKADDYIDVDTRFGEVTRLKNFDNKLFFWQSNSIGVLSVNDRSLISDGNSSQLTLGTGGILTRFDYISNVNGLNRLSINSIDTSSSALYWYDRDRAEILYVSNGIQSVSKAKGVQSLLNKNKKNIEYNVPIVYDKKYNEVLFSLYGISDPKLIN